MRKNSLLASLMPIPSGTPGGNSSAQAGFAALQTRAQVNALIQQAAGGPSASPRLQQNIQDAQGQLSALRNKLSQLTGKGGNELDMPDFKLNAQKTKSFFQRLEYGTNIQSQKANSFFPVTSDIGLSVGYRLNDKSIIGVGASYKLGWGKGGFDNIRFTSEGVGLRTFIDWKLKGSLWISGGYEQNYRTAFNDIAQLRDQRAWQQSGLVGISKVVSLNTKFLKQTKLQLLWDFLSQQQVPRTQPILFRIGYSFN